LYICPIKTTNLILAVVALAFFACSNDSDSQNEPETLIPNGTTDISSQVYLLQKEQIEQAEQCMDNNHDEKACILSIINIPYNGSGVIKNIVHDLNEGMEEKVIDTVEVGFISNGQIDLKFYNPKKEHLTDEGNQAYWDLKLYDNANKPIGTLFLLNREDTDDDFTCFYTYYSEDYKYENTWTHFQEHDIKFVTDIDVKKGWNLRCENDKYEYEDDKIILYTITKTNNLDILNGRKLKWYLLDPDAH